ncbi:uncharacterized protein DUF4375 [Sphingobacterium allocomposti]|uniref:Uncharacterized protein DUF4375 n=1 Tax=Sphingobacterium allocomposti TaxID=415956 RepID=A0A5S5CV99_9SPHI|nr:DUF4375 domain-containing protein [Sphingobacterium composti Yoo et al. 2007 non Ten et al. 2007]TYP87014.1 uncharacterized protein DUF4375 [Sphingobacterium composti Yoo et al. 2007 non Ten et al. 2007]
MVRRIIIMGLIATILNLFACSRRTNDNNSGLSKEVEERLSQSIEAFKNRPIHKELTEQIIDSTPDDNLLQVVFDNLSEKQSTDYEKEYETVMSWNKSRQAIYMIWALEAEVNNGGYNQFYSNSSAQFYKHLSDALELVGANKFADLTNRANETFEQEKSKITQHQDGTIEGFSKSYDDNPLNKYDDEFYELYQTENLQQIQVGFIRRNKKEFIDK